MRDRKPLFSDYLCLAPKVDSISPKSPYGFCLPGLAELAGSQASSCFFAPFLEIRGSAPVRSHPGEK